ncbi:MAG: MarR family transcriptional regulator [Sphingomicrobium sp.]
MPSHNHGVAPRTVYLVKRAETVVRNGLETCLQPLGVTPRQYVTLSLLRDERDQSSADLARKAGITPQSMSETIATLIRKGWIRRLENPGHRRILMTRLTDAGDALLGDCETAVEAMEAKLLSALSRADLETLRRALRIIVKAG